MSKFFLFENHTGDDNDNGIGDIIIEAKDKDDAFDRLPTLDKNHSQEERDKVGYSQDGDVDCLMQFWTEYPDNIEETDAESEDDFMENYGRFFHDDFYLVNEFETLEDAENEKQVFHSDMGIVFMEEKVNDG